MALRWEVCIGCQVENPGLECAGVQRGDKGTWDGDRRTLRGGYLEGGRGRIWQQADSVEEASQKDSGRRCVCGSFWERTPWFVE